MVELRPLLEMRGISKSFSGARALDDVTFRIYPGEVHALMGENGAGKSTLMKILAGAYRADPGGEIRIGGQLIHINGPQEARANGIAVIYQELALAPNLTVAENIHLGREIARAGLIDRTAMYRNSTAVLSKLGATFSSDALVGTLSIAERQLVEIARAVNAKSRILIMDEPSTTLSERETDRLFALVRELRAGGLGIVYISHRMAEVYELADRVSVLRDGRFVGELCGTDIQPDVLVRMMVGRTLTSYYKKEHRYGDHRTAALEIHDMADSRRVRGCTFTVHAGEVLGLAGMVGSGRTELARLVCGADRRTSGNIVVDGQPLEIDSPGKAKDAGLVYLTEDRKSQGLFLDMTVDDNINLDVIGRDARFGCILDRSCGRQRAAEAIHTMGINVSNPKLEVGVLSGGNQQKVLLARLLQTHPKVLILDEPTRGVDIGAKSEIYRIIDDLAQANVGVVVISSELPEIVGIADRVIVMREGRIAGELVGNAVTQENIIGLAMGAHEATTAGARA